MPIVSFRVTAEVHERLLKLAEERSQTLTALMQETASHIVERTQRDIASSALAINATSGTIWAGDRIVSVARPDMPPQHDPNAERWPPKVPYGAMSKKKDKGK